MPGEHGVRRRGRRLAELRGHVVVATGGGQHQRGLPLDRAGQRFVGRRVAGVQGQHHLGRRVERHAADAADHERGVQTELAGDLLVVLAGLLLDVHTDQVDRQPTHAREVPLCREGQVGVATAQVRDPERFLGRRSAQLPLVHRLGHGGVEQPEELLDLAVLVAPGRLEPAVGVSKPEGPEQRVVLRQQPLLVAVVAAVEVGRRGPRRRVHQRVALAGHPQLHGLARRVQVPVAERFVQQLVDRVPRAALLIPGAHCVVRGVRLRLVVRRDLEVATGLEIDVPQLDPAPLRCPGLLPPRSDRPDQRLGVQQPDPDLSESAEEVLGHHLTAAMTTIRSNPTSASGMTRRRWRGFTPPA